MLGGLLVLAVWVVLKTGGREAHALEWGLLSLAPALVLTEPWRRLRRRALLLPVATVAGALLVCLLAPGRMSGMGYVAATGYGAVAFLVVAAYARTAQRTALLGVVVCLMGLDQFSRAFLPWWGSESQATRMIGTFYWHNQYGIYEAAVAMVAVAVVLHGTGRVRALGGLVAVTCLVGVLLSASRMSVLLAGAGLLAFAARAAWRRERRAVLGVVGLAVGTAVLQAVLTGPLFFPGSGTAVSGLGARSEGVSVSANDRVEYWKVSAGAFADRPLAGSGWGSFRDLTVGELPGNTAGTPYAHSAFFQAFAEGGAVGGLPLAAAAAVATVAAALVFARRREPDDADEPLLAARDIRSLSVAARDGAAMATLVLLLHSAMDFDWTYPALFGMTGVCAGLALAPAARRGPVGQPATAEQALPLLRIVLTAASAAALVGLLALGSYRATDVRSEIIAASRIWEADPVAAARSLDRLRIAGLPDPRIDEALLAVALPERVGKGLALPADDVRRAVRGTARRADVSPRLALRRVQAEALLDPVAGLPRLLAAVRAQEVRRPNAVLAYSDVLINLGRQAEARTALSQAVLRYARPEQARSNVVWDLVLALVDLDKGEVGRCGFDRARAAFGVPRSYQRADPGPPSNVANCPATLEG